jgi:glutaredoxin
MVKITDLLLESDYTIFYRQGCPYCKKALTLLENKNVKKIDIENKLKINKKKASKKELLDLLQKNIKGFDISHVTVPIIFQGTTFIGGCEELEKHLNI